MNLLETAQEMDNIEENLLRLLQSGIKENVLLAFQLQEGIQSKAFEELVQVYDKIRCFIGYPVLHESIWKLGNLADKKMIELHWRDEMDMPEEIRYMFSLKAIVQYSRKSCTQLKSIPNAIGELQHLEVIEVCRGKLTTLPDTFGGLQSLQSLDLAHNQIIALPTSFGNLKKLEKLSLYDNKLTSFPHHVLNLPNLCELFLGWNTLKEIPVEISKLQNLRVLNLRKCGLETLPETIGELENLEEIILGHNPLTLLPMCLLNLRKIKVIDVTNTHIEHLPEKIYTHSEPLYLELNNFKELRYVRK